MSPSDRALVEWLCAEGFEQHELSWETVWAHDSGYGRIVLRLMPVDAGWWVIVEDPRRKQVVNLGTCGTLDKLQDIYHALSSMRHHESLQ